MRLSPFATTAVFAGLLAAASASSATAADPSPHRLGSARHVAAAPHGATVALSGSPRVVYGTNDPASATDRGYAVAQGYGEPAGVDYGFAREGGDAIDGRGSRPTGFHRVGFPSAGYGGTGYGSGYGFAPPIPPAGGLAVYSPGAYGPGPRIIRIPRGYGMHPGRRTHGCCGASAGSD